MSTEPQTEVNHLTTERPETAGPTPAGGQTAWQRRWRIFWREWLRPLLIIGLIMGSFRSAVADWNDVPTGSMKPTILEGDRIFINKIAYDLKFPFTTWRLLDWGDPQWGDIVVLRSPEDGKRLVKRVVGLPGDVIEVRYNRLVVNGTVAEYYRLDPSIVNQIDDRTSYVFRSEVHHGRQHPIMIKLGSPPMPYGPKQVPPDHYFVMGDHRDNSRDSRMFGPVPRKSILGRATAVALSGDPDAYYKPRWQRFFSPLR
ncbi:MAG: signal peptidase I [Acidobacteria bacterium]|nr:MAG: signal peptidase I [Acidobacteriota bacterium]